MNNYWKFRTKHKIKQKHGNCLFCNGADFHHVRATSNRYMLNGVRFYGLDPDINICVCKSCGVVFEDKIFSKDYYDEFYKRFYYNVYKGFKINNFEWEKEFALRNYERLKILGEVLDKNKSFRILEVGCWDGSFLKEVKEQYPKAQIVGIESCEDSCEMAKKINPELKIHNKTFEDFEDNKKFDVIVLGCVIRHFFNPIESFKKIRRMLKDNGYLYFDYGEDLFESHIRNPKNNPYI